MCADFVEIDKLKFCKLRFSMRKATKVFKRYFAFRPGYKRNSASV